MPLILEPLSRQRCVDLFDELAAIAAGVSDWREKEFFFELPDKWTLSFTAWDRELVGYVIMSRRWSDRIHIHQFMVKRTWQNKAVGGQMMARVVEAHRNELLSLKVKKENVRAFKFYERNGFVKENSEREYFWMTRAPTEAPPGLRE